MFKLHQKILILFIFFLSFPANNIISSGPTSGFTPRLINGTDDLLQFTAGGHVLGFKKGEMFIASGDHALRIEFVNARPVSPGEEIKSRDPGTNRDAAQPLGRVTYRDLWAGVTLMYEKHGSGVVKSTYNVQPTGIGAIDPVDQIRLHYNVPVKVDGSGNLLLSFATGEMRESRPVAWQEIEGKRVPAEVTYRLIADQEVGFKAGSYDPRYPLVIDPALSWNTFLGGSGWDEGYAIAIDTSGNIYVAGHSSRTWGSPVRPFVGYYCAFAAKLNSNGVLQWNTFLGATGSDSDSGLAIAVDTSGNVYVSGWSAATWGSPVRPFTAGPDAFVAKLNGNGALQWNTFLGASFDDRGFALTVDTSGNVYVAGESWAAWGSPVHPYTLGGDAFIAKLNGSGVLQWNTFLGSSSTDSCKAIALDISGSIYVAGFSYGTWGSPVRPFVGSYDAFAAKLNTSGVLQWNTFLGGLDSNEGNAIAVDTSGNIYVAGYSHTTWGSPVRPYTGNDDAFVAKLDSNGVLQWSTFLGGSDTDRGCGIAADTSGNIYVAGYSHTTWGSPIRPFAGVPDAFIAKLYGNGALQWNTFLGSSSNDHGYAIVMDANRNIYIAGTSYATWSSPVRPYTGSYDAFVAKIGSWVKNDFNRDGYEDILWRYYGSGGKNALWYMKSATYIGSAGLPAVTDLNWKIVGTGDFNGDGWPDILWRYYVSGGKNALWYMKGATKIGYADLPAATDLNWKIVGTGDFNGDGWPDILWRNCVSGYNAVWYIKGVTKIGYADVPAVTDLNWKIVGTGDFNGDGWPDILWRNYVSGYNAVWYMKGATYFGSAALPPVTDIKWQIVGTGDFKGDGWPDILWRYNGSGGKNALWYMKGATKIGYADLPAATDLNWKIENH